MFGNEYRFLVGNAVAVLIDSCVQLVRHLTHILLFTSHAGY